jgi:hypothetical protein
MIPGGGNRSGPGYGNLPGPDHIICAICADPIRLDQYRQARCWTDPDGTTVAAHAPCLIRIGEEDLDLRADKGAGPGTTPTREPGPA